MRNRFIALLLSIIAIPLPVMAASSYSSLYVFGDSVSDTGNLYAQTGGTTPQSPPYYNGRYSNGILFPEYLQPLLGLPINNSTNFAYAGAKTGTASPDDILSQVNLFAGSHTLPSTALVSIFGGANDYFANAGGVASNAMVNNTVGNIVTSVTTLSRVGGTAFLVPNLINLGATPYAAGVGQSVTLSDATNRHNATLLSALSTFQQQHPGITVVMPDTQALFRELITNPTAYGITNTTIPCIDITGTATGACATPQAAAQTLFFDPIHPTTAADSILAQFYNANIIAATTGPQTIGVQSELARIGSEATYRQERNHFDALQYGNKEAIYQFSNREASVYLRGNFSMGHRDEQSDQSGFLYHNSNGLLGLDYDLHKGVIIGANTGYGEATAKLEQGAGSVDLNTYSTNIYGLYSDNRFYTDIVAGFDYLDFNDIQRATGFSFTPESFASTSGHNIRLGSEIGYKFPVYQDVKIGPLAGLRYTNTHIDGYTESGANLLNLNVSSQQGSSLITEIGMNASGNMKLAGMNIQPHARAAFEHELQNDSNDLKVQLNGNLPYAIDGNTENHNLVRLSGGIETMLNEATSLDISYETAIMNNGYDHALSGNLKYHF